MFPFFIYKSKNKFIAICNCKRNKVLIYFLVVAVVVTFVLCFMFNFFCLFILYKSIVKFGLVEKVIFTSYVDKGMEMREGDGGGGSKASPVEIMQQSDLFKWKSFKLVVCCKEQVSVHFHKAELKRCKGLHNLWRKICSS